MSSKAANGSTVTFNSYPLGTARSIDDSSEGAKIDMAHLTSTQHTYEVGLPDNEVTVEILGSKTLAIGDTGSLSIAWNDGGSDSLGSCVVQSAKSNGEVDGEISSTYVFVPKDA